jgi:hypothetical protein
MAALFVAGGAESNRTRRAGRHRVIVFFMSLDIRAELELAVLGIIQTGANNNGPRAKGIRYAIMGGETIQPKRAVGDHFNDQPGGEALEQQSIVNALSALFKGANVSSTSGTCSSFDTVLSVTWRSAILPRRGSN